MGFFYVNWKVYGRYMKVWNLSISWYKNSRHTKTTSVGRSASEGVIGVWVGKPPMPPPTALWQSPWQLRSLSMTSLNSVWFLRAPRWYIGPTAMPRAAVTPIAPERSECAIGCDSRPRHCRRDDIPAWRPNKITLISLLTLDLTMYNCLISFLRSV